MDNEVLQLLIQDVGVWGLFTLTMWWVTEKRNVKRENTLMEIHKDREELIFNKSIQREERLIQMHQLREEVLTEVVEKNQNVILKLSSALEDVKEVKLDLREVKDLLNFSKQ